MLKGQKTKNGSQVKRVNYLHDAHEYQSKMQRATSHYMWTNPNKAKDLAEDLKPIPPSKCVAGKSTYISPMMMDQINRRISPSYHFKRK